ncbi:MAG TPA: TonB-dependent receptor [Planctomycetaceae bacterium]|nr:TonB-dependent receptor [Planctomycetaceae bacterium]
MKSDRREVLCIFLVWGLLLAQPSWAIAEDQTGGRLGLLESGQEAAEHDRDGVTMRVGDLLPMTDRLMRLNAIEAEPIDVRVFGGQGVHISDLPDDSWWMVEQASMLQPTPFTAPRAALSPGVAQSNSSARLSSAVFDSTGVDRSLLRQSGLVSSGFSVDRVQGEEGLAKVSTDVGSLLGKSSGALGISVQKRTPVVNDPRVRSSRIGSLAASGSHWVPARVDLDSVLSKIDSRQVGDVLIIPGPYSSMYGPGFQFVDFELARSPRFADGYQMHGQTSSDYKSNGNQIFGQQSLFVGAEDWGMRASYSHRKGGNYEAGNGQSIPASYESREFTVAYGEDLGDGRSIEFSLLRLDQTDIEFPGYVFDIDYLVTNGYSLTYTDTNATISDSIETNLWYNRTRFAGNAQSPAKREQFPFLNRINYVGTTDVDSMSTGYRQKWSWGKESDAYRFTVGQDLRFIRQELQELSSGETLGLPIPYTNRNSPIPDSYSVNPGIFTEYVEELGKKWTIRTGGRLDFAGTDILERSRNLQEIGLGVPPATYAEIMGTDEYQREFFLWSIYAAIDRKITDRLVGTFNVGYAERPPSLTDLYAAESFMLLLQNGLNNVTGDPSLDREKMIQCDLSLDYEGDFVRAGARGFYSWAFDYITFENTGVGTSAPNNQITQVSLRSVNTDFATLAGFETFMEIFPKEKLTPFVNVRYVEGTDRSRDGDFATRSGGAGAPSQKFAGLSRGFFSGIGGADSEPLPGISPLEARIGCRLRPQVINERWNLELAARVVDDQNLVAASLLESTTAGFTTWDLRGTWRPWERKGITLVSGVENFTNKNYREHLDFRSRSGSAVFQPGINFYLGGDVYY